MNGGIGWKLITLALDRDPWKLYLMFQSREIDIKLCQLYTKINIYTILNKSSRFKQIIFNQIRNQSENDDIPQEPEILRFAPIIVFFYFAF